MTSRLRFRNIDADPSAPVETWPQEGVQAALERGSITDYRRLAAAVRRAPWGPFARGLEHVLTYSQPYGAAALMRRAIDAARAQADADARAEVARQLNAAREASGLTRAEFAARLGTSASRMSTYLSGAVTPSASLLVRALDLAQVAGADRG
jgi:DNA-binding transcriptional regulator YiaG